MRDIEVEESEITQEIIRLNNALKRKRHTRLGFVYASALGFLLALICLLTPPILSLWHISFGDPSKVIIGFVAIGAISLVFSLFFDVSSERARKSQLETRLNALDAIKGIDQSSVYFREIGQTAISMLDEFFELIGGQYKQSSSIMNISVIVSFVMILGGCVVSILFADSGKEQTYISLLSSVVGIITLFISNVFFRLHRKDSSDLSSYKDSAHKLVNLVLLLNIVARLNGADKEHAIQELIKTLLPTVSSRGHSMD